MYGGLTHREEKRLDRIIRFDTEIRLSNLSIRTALSLAAPVQTGTADGRPVGVHDMRTAIN
jgi:hypothetical protein